LKDIRSYIYVRSWYIIIGIWFTFDSSFIYFTKGLDMEFAIFFVLALIVIFGILEYFGVGDD
tara:strand:+ start:728 stop:913 length:186 start_codon:yes stop_codon:yes gene_type:complete